GLPGESTQTIEYTTDDDAEEKPQTRKHHSDSISTELTTKSDGTPSNDGTDAATKEEDQKPSCCSDQLSKMAATADWWSLYIGLASFALTTILVFTIPYDLSGLKVIPSPGRWEQNPMDAWSWYSFIGTVLLLSFFCAVYLLAQRFMGGFNKKPASQYVKGFFLIGVIATFSLWLGGNIALAKNGLGYAIWSIVLGMMYTNTPISKLGMLSSLKVAAKDGEFFIKCSLALLATEFSVLARVGLPSILVAWIGSPLALVLGYNVCRRLFKMETEVSLLTAVGATWCGASAISATGSVIDASSSNISLSISVVALFTVVFTFAQPYFAIGVGMPEDVAGAWIGGSVDQTGNVIASAAIISEEATEVAAIVKLILNSGLGVLCTAIAFWWQTKADENGNKGKFSWLFLWDKLPKFILGYFLCSGMLSVVLPLIEGLHEAETYQKAVLDLNKWLFAIGFVGIGVMTDIKELWAGAIGSGVIQGYLVTNTFDILISLALSYATF
ncbi:hypothetical protein ACHAWO_004187, partial [Cyclotella atomus]